MGGGRSNFEMTCLVPVVHGLLGSSYFPIVFWTFFRVPTHPGMFTKPGLLLWNTWKIIESGFHTLDLYTPPLRCPDADKRPFCFLFKLQLSWVVFLEKQYRERQVQELSWKFGFCSFGGYNLVVTNCFRSFP